MSRKIAEIRPSSKREIELNKSNTYAGKCMLAELGKMRQKSVQERKLGLNQSNRGLGNEGV